MLAVKTPLEIPYSSYSFRRWLESAELKGQNKDFVDRLSKDQMAPQAVGPRTPTVLMSYVMKQLDTNTSRAEYRVTDVNAIWSLWQLWTYERGDYETPETGDLQPMERSNATE